MTTMLKKEFNILQNIENRRVLQYHPPKRQDCITKNTINKLDTDSKQKKKATSSNEEEDIANIKGKCFCFEKFLLLFWAVTRIATTSVIKIFQFDKITNFFLILWAVTKITMANTADI